MRTFLKNATIRDVDAIAMLHATVAQHLTRDFGKGPWSSTGSEKGVLYAMRNSTLFVVRESKLIIGVLGLGIRKPWAIDKSLFTRCKRPLYLTGMAVMPDMQRRGIGRAMLEDAQRIARGLTADAIRLDAYDAMAGAGEFYEKCGFREVGRAVYRGVPLIYYEMLLPVSANSSCKTGKQF